MTTPKQFEQMASQAQRDSALRTAEILEPLPNAHWDAVLHDPRGQAEPVPILHRRLSEIPRHILRVSCRRCDHIVEIQTADAMRLYGQHAIWKDVGRRLLDDGCQQRTGSREDDGCRPSYDVRLT
jgi:hypothetical protein